MNPAALLREQGVAVLRGALASDTLSLLKESAERCFEDVRAGKAIAEHYRFHPVSHSVLLAGLSGFGCALEDLVAPLSAPGIADLISEGMGCEWRCGWEHSWLRKKFAPARVPSQDYRPHSWHQDGGLGIAFPFDPRVVVPMTELLTCWIPLNRCGRQSPGLEFVRGRQVGLVHFMDLDDADLRLRFAPEEFWAPELEFGDALVFLNSVLHRTHVCKEMTEDRMSLEYRMFPRGD